MSWSVTFSKKKFQLFQPMGGVCATNSCGTRGAFAGVFAGTDVCDAAVRDARARTAEESKTTMRMVAFLKMISGKIVCRKHGNQQPPACEQERAGKSWPSGKTGRP
jgi:hypothetical protein